MFWRLQYSVDENYRDFLVYSTLLQGLMLNSNIYSGCCRTKQQGWRNFPTCVYLQGQWKFPTQSNIHSGSFQHIPISTVEVSNTFQHEYRNFPVNFFTHCGILQHFKTNIEESFQNEYRILETKWNSPTFITYVEELP